MERLLRMLDAELEPPAPTPKSPEPGGAEALPAAPAALPPPGPPRGFDAPAHWDTCPDCDAATEEGASGQEAVCPRCSRVFARPTAEETAVLGGTGALPGARPAPPLRMVGEGASRHQKVLDRTAVTNADEAASMDIYRELQRYNHEYAGRKFSQAVLRSVAETYAADVRTVQVNRSQNKQAILANIVSRQGQQMGEPRGVAECAELLQLRNKGLARGETRMRGMGVCVALLNADQVGPWLGEAFRRMGLQLDERPPPSQAFTPAPCTSVVGPGPGERAAAERLRAAAAEIIAAGTANYVGVEMQPRTRAICAAFAALRRSAMGGQLPAAWGFAAEAEPLPGSKGSLDWASAACEIRPQTMKNHLRVLFEYHSLFAPVYQKYAMWAAPSERL